MSEIDLAVKNKRHSMRMNETDYDTLHYWSEKFEMNKTEFLIFSMYHYIRWRNQDYDLPTAEIQRLNQLTDVIANLASRQEALETSVHSGFDSILGVIRGDNYLVDAEDGEL